jgi:hypothetical protein
MAASMEQIDRLDELVNSAMADMECRLATVEAERDEARRQLAEIHKIARLRTVGHARDDHSQNCGWCQVEKLSAARAAGGE